METAGRADMAADPRYATNKDRIEHQAAIDEAIAAWTGTLPCAEVVSTLESVGVPAGPINSAADLCADEHLRARGQFESVEVNGAPLVLPALGPKLSETPGRTDWPGGELGADNDALLG